MNPRFITKKIHSFLDYPVAVSLMALPFLLGLGESNPVGLWLSVATGVAALVLTLFTDHQLGVIRVLPYRFHLAVDALVGVSFLVAPLLLNLSGIDALYYWINGAAVMVVVGLHHPEEAPDQKAEWPVAA